jgi:hypothetical protein
MKVTSWLALATLALCIGRGAAQNAGVVQRGESHQGMGFSQTATIHHFYLTRSGGTIQVTAKDPKDAAEIAMVQTHLKHIVGMFSEGDFSIPHFVHDRNPPGADTMSRLRTSIRYSSEMMDNGGSIKIETDSPEALAAIHEFLRFQIKDHETGDPLTVAN